MATKRELIKAIEAAMGVLLTRNREQYRLEKEKWVNNQVDFILNSISEEEYQDALRPVKDLAIRIQKRISHLEEVEGPQARVFVLSSLLASEKLHTQKTLKDTLFDSAMGYRYLLDRQKGYATIDKKQHIQEDQIRSDQITEQFTAILGNCSRMKAKEIEEYLTGLGLDWIIEEHKTPEQKFEVMAPVDVKLIQQLHAAQE